MTSHEELAALVAEVSRQAGMREALMALSVRLVDTATALQRVQEVDESPDLLPELQAAAGHLESAAECIKSMAAVVDARFKNAIELD